MIRLGVVLGLGIMVKVSFRVYILSFAFASFLPSLLLLASWQ